MKYLSRVADKMLQERLEAFGAVLIEGPKWTGKTTTAEQQAKSVIKLQNPDKVNEYLATARTKPSLLLKGEQPRLIDECIDISPDDSKDSHKLMGYIFILVMRPVPVCLI